MISIVIPTVPGREASLERCEIAYRTRTPGGFEILVARGFATCGEAWNWGVEHASGFYVHLTADDLEPLEGWAESAVAATERDEIPAPRIVNADGSLQSCGEGSELPTGARTPFSRIPFLELELARDRVFPIPPLHYYSDNLVTERCGLPAVVAREYAFVHHFEPAGRLDDRMAPDGATYAELVR